VNLVTVIPARGGSKSIPYKNIQLLGGRPLISYTIEYSKKCSYISHTVVSTDSILIAKKAKEYGAEVPFLRPSNISGDDIQDYPVMLHALNSLEILYSKKIDAVVLLRPTSPLRPENLIERAVKILEALPECTSIRSVITSDQHPYRQWIMNDNFIEGYVNDVEEPFNLPRQILPELFFQTGDLELVKRETLHGGSVSGNRVAPLIIKSEEMFDIDYIEDLRIAELKLGDDK
jgi:CMP-N,N'-diacetyllegionaminic acid synthase